jgi:hypothetical protein
MTLNNFLEEKAKINNKIKIYRQYGFPLSKEAQHATLHAVLGNISVADAARVSGLTEQQIINEAEAWAAAPQVLGEPNGD